MSNRPRSSEEERGRERAGLRRSGLAHLEAGEAVDRQAGLVEDLLHRALGLGDRRLLEQDEVLVVGIDPTFDDLGDRLLGLALLLGGLLGDAALGLDGLGRHLLAGEVARARGGDVHRQSARRVLAATVVLHRDTDRRGQVGGPLVQVHRGRALEEGEPRQDQLLTDAGRLGLDQLLDGLAVDLGGQQGRQVGRVLLDRDLEKSLGEGDEVAVLRDEVGLAVQLQQRAALAHDDAVGRRALEALADVLGALDAHKLDRLVVLAIGLGEGLLGVHHAGAGGVTETLDVGSGEGRHVSSLWCSVRARDGGQPFWAPWVPVSGLPVAGTPSTGATSSAVTVGGSAGVSGSSAAGAATAAASAAGASAAGASAAGASAAGASAAGASAAGASAAGASAAGASAAGASAAG